MEENFQCPAEHKALNIVNNFEMTGIYLSKVFEEIKDSTTTSFMSSQDTLETNFDISPQDFISYAETDLTLNYDHNYVNALSNSKRALDCQLDSLLVSFGYYPLSQKEQWSFPKKLDFIKELGVIAPRVLRKINKQRNLLEHQFVKPKKETVEDFLDITMLFIASTDKYTLKFKSGLRSKNEKLDRSYHLENLYQEQKFVLTITDFKNRMLVSTDNKGVLEKYEIVIGNSLYKSFFNHLFEGLKTAHNISGRCAIPFQKTITLVVLFLLFLIMVETTAYPEPQIR